MESLKVIKKRVTSVKNTQKITNAMKLVSSAKFNKANKSVLGARPYSQSITSVLASLLTQDMEHPLLVAKSEHKVLVLVFTSDRGLCGALNANLLKHLCAELQQRYGSEFTSVVDFIALGKKAEQFFRKKKFNVLYSKHHIEQLNYAVWQQELIAELVTHFQKNKYDAIYLSYQLFVSALKQEPVFTRILPIGRESISTQQETADSDFLIEPGNTEILELALFKYASNQIYQAILNSVASEHRSRMNAMDNATNNAKKAVKELTLKYNRGRQAAITKELIEITAGVQTI